MNFKSVVDCLIGFSGGVVKLEGLGITGESAIDGRMGPSASGCTGRSVSDFSSGDTTASSDVIGSGLSGISMIFVFSVGGSLAPLQSNATCSAAAIETGRM